MNIAEQNLVQFKEYQQEKQGLFIVCCCSLLNRQEELLRHERALAKELEAIEKRIENIEKNEHHVPIKENKPPPKLIVNDVSDALPPEVVQFQVLPWRSQIVLLTMHEVHFQLIILLQAFLKEQGGHTGGWPEKDHQLFLQILSQCKVCISNQETPPLVNKC